MPKKIEKWSCLLCGVVYQTEKEALDCEKKPVEEAICKVGDVVKIDGKAEIICEIYPEERTHKLRYRYVTGCLYYVYKDKIVVN